MNGVIQNTSSSIRRVCCSQKWSMPIDDGCDCHGHSTALSKETRNWGLFYLFPLVKGELKILIDGVSCMLVLLSIELSNLRCTIQY